MVTALAGALSMTLVSGAQAQNMAADLMPPQEVSSLVASMGLRPLGPPVWRGDRYVLFAIDRHGQRVRVMLDAHSGQVLAVRPTMRDSGRYPRYGGYRGYGAPPPYGYDQGYAPPPPPGYPQEGGYAPGRYDPRFGAPPPAAIPGGPPLGEDDYFDYDRQEGSLTGRPRVVSRGEPAGNAQSRLAPAAPKEQAARQAAKNIAPMPKPRPPLAASEHVAPNAAIPNQAPPAEAVPAPQSARPKPGEAIRF